MASTTQYLSLLALTIILGFTVGSTSAHLVRDGRLELRSDLVEGNGVDSSHSPWRKKMLAMGYQHQKAPLVDGCTEEDEYHSVHCTGESVTEIPDDLKQSIEHITFTNTGIKQIPEGILGNYTNLKNIRFTQHTIEEISPGAFRGLSNLERLYLEDNKLSDASFGTETFEDMSSLTHIILDSNQLTKLPKYLLNATTSLQVLQIKNNRIDQNGLQLISPLHNLAHLDLSNNYFSSLDQAVFGDMLNLEELYLNYNQISNIGTGTLKGLDKLEYFKVRNMNATLTVQDDAFNTHLKFLDLSNNHGINISTLAFGNAQGLEEIQLKDCGLSRLDGAAFKDKLNLRKLIITNNPFACDCNAAWMAEAKIDSKPWALDWGVNEQSPQCASPSWLSGQDIFRLFPQDLTCDKPKIVAITETFSNHTWTEALRIEAQAANGQAQTKWVYPDGSIQECNRLVLYSNHSVAAWCHVSAESTIALNMTGLINFTLTASNVAGESSMTFSVFAVPAPNSVVGGPSVPSVSILLLLVSIVHYMK